MSYHLDASHFKPFPTRYGHVTQKDRVHLLSLDSHFYYGALAEWLRRLTRIFLDSGYQIHSWARVRISWASTFFFVFACLSIYLLLRREVHGEGQSWIFFCLQWVVCVYVSFPPDFREFWWTESNSYSEGKHWVQEKIRAVLFRVYLRKNTKGDMLISKDSVRWGRRLTKQWF
jgi:hypothetical protein